MNPLLYGNALVTARHRQLRARATRPLARRRFPTGDPPSDPVPVTRGAELWRSGAFEASPIEAPGTRLERFYRSYGEEVLAAARGGDLEAARADVDAWIAANPPRNDDAWHPYPLSTRIGNWIAAMTLQPQLVSPPFTQSLWAQLARLGHNVEDDILGNHVIRNAKAFVLGGAAFGASALVRRGVALLERELPEQILADGGHYERSPAYHLVVLRDLLEVQAVLPGLPIGDTIERMKAFAAALRRPDGLPALCNDGTVDAPRLELPPCSDGLQLFPEAGFAVLRDRSLWLVFRCGPPGPPYLPAHAHADALSIQIWWDGRPVVVDPGTFTYEAGAERDWFRGTAAHSTVTVDGNDQFRLWGAFRTGRLPRVELLSADEASLEACVHLRHGTRHVRRIEWNPGECRIDVSDRISGRGTHLLESRLVWAPDAPDVEVSHTGGETRVESAWLSERFGERVATTASLLRTETSLPTRLAWSLRFPVGADSSPGAS